MGAYRDLILASDPAFYWPLGEQAGTVARAAVGSAGTYGGSPLRGHNGPDGKWPWFDGSDDQVASPTVAMTYPATIEGLCFPQKTGRWFPVWGRFINNSNNFRLFIEDDVWLAQCSVGGSFYTAGPAKGSGTAPNDRLTHAAAVHTGSSLQVWVNGILTASTAIGGGSFNLSTTHIGYEAQDGWRARGNIGHVAIHNRALAGIELRKRYAVARGLFGRGQPHRLVR